MLSKYRGCATYNDFELYLMFCDVMLLLLIIYIIPISGVSFFFDTCLFLNEVFLSFNYVPERKHDGIL